MAALPEEETWEPGVYQIKKTDMALGGIPNMAQGLGVSNLSNLHLANRTSWLLSLLIECSDRLGSGDDFYASVMQFLSESTVNDDRLVSAGDGISGGGDLTADRALELDFASQAEAVALAATDRVMSPLRIKQALADFVSSELGAAADEGWSLSAGDALSGGGDLRGDRSIAALFATKGEAKAMLRDDRVLSALRAKDAVEKAAVDLSPGFVPSIRKVKSGTGVSGGGALSQDRTLSVDFASDAVAAGGVSEDTVLSPRGAKRLIEAKAVGLGINQTWQNVTGGRIEGVAYQNTSDRAIGVFINHADSGGSGESGMLISVSSNGTNWLRACGRNDRTSIFIVVPVGQWYRIDEKGAVFIVAELR